MRNKVITQRLLCALGLWLFSQQSGQCFYAPGLQRWINRDPIGEAGGQNLFEFSLNAPNNYVDTKGLTIWVCTRTTSGFPMFGFGRHAYLWDDRPSAARVHSCGMEEPWPVTFGKDPGLTTGPTDEGPINNSGLNLPPFPGIPYPGPSKDVECYPVPGSEGQEDAIMNTCHNCANRQKFSPFRDQVDCHTACDRALMNSLMPETPHRRFNSPQEEQLYRE